jgi:hypothetical protein
VRRRLTALVACVALVAVPLGGCGGDKAPGIPKSDAGELVNLLKKIREDADNPQRCDALLATLGDLQAKVASLPSDVDRDVRDSLANGVKNLATSAQAQCAKTTTTPTTTTPTIPQPTTTIPQPTITIPPTTTTTVPQPTTTIPTTPTPTSPNGNGGGGSGGGGNGGTGGTGGPGAGGQGSGSGNGGAG